MALPPQERQRRLASLNERELAALRYDWSFWARPDQLSPAAFSAGDKTYWLILAGRGFGKTRSGAEQVRAWARTHEYVNVIGATADDARDIMVEGESGILAVCPRHERPDYLAHKSRLEWKNGAKTLIFTADSPERLRGKQHAALWCDELASWRYPEAWDQAMFGLRLGEHPQAIITTTPRPTATIRNLMADPQCIVTRGTSYDNRDNLAPTFFDAIVARYEGTRLGRQELNAEILDDNPNALWQRARIDELRVREAPEMSRIVVAVDPPVTSREDSDEAGIVACGLGVDGHYYVLHDRSLRGSPETWARAAVRLYHDTGADRLIAETNNGGDMVEVMMRNVDRNVAYKAVTASRGKIVRAEPIAALYEQGRVHHVGAFPALEDQMVEYDPVTSTKSPDRMDALVWALTELSAQTASGLLDYYAQAAAMANAAHRPPAPLTTTTREGIHF